MVCGVRLRRIIIVARVCSFRDWERVRLCKWIHLVGRVSFGAGGVGAERLYHLGRF